MGLGLVIQVGQRLQGGQTDSDLSSLVTATRTGQHDFWGRENVPWGWRITEHRSGQTGTEAPGVQEEAWPRNARGGQFSVGGLRKPTLGF